MSRDDDDKALLSALGKVGRSREEENDRLERSVSGEPVAEPGFASRPIDPGVREAIVERAIAALGPPRPSAVRRPWLRWGGASVTLLAAAAAIALYVGTSRRSSLPAYELEASESVRTTRGAEEAKRESGVVRVGEMAPLFLIARPVSRPREPVGARVFGRGHDRWTELEADILVAEEGSARIEIQPSVLAGIEELRIVVAPRGSAADEWKRRAERGEALPLRIERGAPR